jgi:hypothetical protein
MSLEQNKVIAENQKFWRKAKRGLFSRPLELPHTANIIHERIVKTFNLDEDSPTPILTWSLLFDRAKTPSSTYTYKERFPEKVADEDKLDYSVGIARITEYATNRATRIFIEKNLDAPLLKELGTAYARITDLLTYEILLNGTYRRMAGVESTAEQNGKDFNHAIEEALFRHDFTPINELIKDTEEFSGWSDIEDLAIEIGKKKFKKPDLAKWLDKLEIEHNDNKIKAGVKSTVTSVAAGGVFRSPGITEVSGGMIGLVMGETCLFLAANLADDFIKNPTLLNSFSGLIAQDLALAVAPVIAITPAIAIHELIHAHSSNEEFYGLIPATQIKKETIPYLARLEK